MLQQKRQHLLGHAWIELRRRVVIEVNQFVRRRRHDQILGTESQAEPSRQIAK